MPDVQGNLYRHRVRQRCHYAAFTIFSCTALLLKPWLAASGDAWCQTTRPVAAAAEVQGAHGPKLNRRCALMVPIALAPLASAGLPAKALAVPSLQPLTSPALASAPAVMATPATDPCTADCFEECRSLRGARDRALCQEECALECGSASVAGKKSDMELYAEDAVRGAFESSLSGATNWLNATFSFPGSPRAKLQARDTLDR